MADLLTYDEHDVAAVLGRVVFFRGREIVEQGFVVDVAIDGDGDSLLGRVRNAEQTVYQQRIWLTRQATRLRIRSTCTCPVGQNCKHVAAVLIAQGRARGTPAAAIRPSDVVAPTETRTAVRSWLDQVVQVAARTPVADVPRGAQLHYILLISGTQPARIALKAGHLSGPWSPDRQLESDIQWHDLSRQSQATWREVAGEDVSLLRGLLALSPPARDGEPLALPPTADALMVLKRMVGTGRAHVAHPSNAPLQWVGSASGSFRWLEHPDGTQSLVLEPAGGDAFAHVLDVGGPLFIAADNTRIGVIDAGVPAELARLLMQAPLLDAREATQVRGLLTSTAETHGVARAIPLPEAGEAIIHRRVLPRPQLHLFTGRAATNPSAQRIHFVQPVEISEPIPMARLRFVYSGSEVDYQDPTSVIELREDDALVMITRDQEAEQRALEKLQSVAMRPLEPALWQLTPSLAGSLAVQPPKPPHGDWYRRALDPRLIIDFVAEQVPKLVAAGWDVTFADDFPFRVADASDVGWWADAQAEAGRIDWIAFELGVIVAGERLNIVPYLVQAMERLPQSVLARAHEPDGEKLLLKALERQKTYAKLADGRLLPLPAARLAPMLRGMLELVGPRGDRVVDGKVRLHRAEAASLSRVAAGLGTSVAWAADGAKLVALGDRLIRGRGATTVLPPSTFRAHLRDYQSDGLAWMAFLQEARLGGVLADDMGLGKTVQALAFLAREKAEGRLTKPALIVAPTSVLPNWQAEAARFAPTLNVLALRGADRHELFSQIAESDLVLTTYPLLARDQDVLLAQPFHVAILDEAQAIKNPKAAITSVAHRIDAAHRFALTGTPLENNLGEVWSLFEFLTPGLLGDEATFRRVFRTPIEKHGSAEAQRFLTQRLKPFLLRRTKREVATELPPKTEIIERITLEGAQRDLYETVRVMMEKRVREEIAAKGLAKSHIIVLDALLKMRQVCCDPRLLKLAQAQRVTQSAKLERLMELVPEMVAEGRRILLFSQFTSMLDLIAAELRTAGIPFVTLTGSTEDRAAPVAQFQAGTVPVFLLSLKAGGTGLNLTAADTVIHYDPWWNPAVESQATDRAYRIGQDKPVFVYKLMVEEGIEEAMEQLKARKAALAEALFEGGAKTPMALDESDLAALFRPLSGVSARRAA